MAQNDFFSDLDEKSIIDAIRSAEQGTTGEIRVFVARHGTQDVAADARRRFRKLRMHKTAHRNAVLIYLVPADRQFAVLGDTGVHDRVGSDFWTSVSGEMTQHLHKNNSTAALLAAIDKIAAELIKHFPCAKGGANTIPDSIGREN
jgi:uncharacterized membrane protein